MEMADNSKEEFIYIGNEKEVMQKLQDEIKKCGETFSSLMGEIKDLEDKIGCSVTLTGQYQCKLERFQSKILENEQALIQDERTYQEQFNILQEEHLDLNEKVKEIQEEIDRCERTTKELEEVCVSGIERKMVFKGQIANCSSGFSVKHQIRYPVKGGSALVTFKKQSVAEQVIADIHHTIKVEDYQMSVKAESVELLVLDNLCMRMNLSPRKILVYNLPRNVSEEIMLDKLELYFAKSKNGGGEVEKTEFLSDCRSVIITFINESVVPHLLEKKFFLVPFGESSHQVLVAPSLDGNLQNYELKTLKCNRTVLLTDIPEITEKDNMQDLMELHFCKASKDGVQTLIYFPKGESAVAIFEEDQYNLHDTE